MCLCEIYLASHCEVVIGNVGSFVAYLNLEQRWFPCRKECWNSLLAKAAASDQVQIDDYSTSV